MKVEAICFPSEHSYIKSNSGRNVCKHCGLVEMTRDEILKMEAGRELDALVAEKIMGWDRVPPSEWKTAPDVLLPPVGSTGRKEGRMYRVPHYSTDIAAAWEVVDKMSILNHVVIENFDNDYGVIIDNYSQYWEAHATDAPLAICWAALLAVLLVKNWKR